MGYLAAKRSSSPTCPQHLTRAGGQNRADPPKKTQRTPNAPRAAPPAAQQRCKSSTKRASRSPQQCESRRQGMQIPPLHTRSHAVPKSAPSPGHSAVCWGYFCSKRSPAHPPFHFLQLLQVRGCPKSHPLGMQSLRPDPGGDAKAHPKPCEVSCSPAKTLLGSNRPDLFFLIPGKTSLSPGLTQPTGAAALTKKGKNPPELTIPRVNPIQAPLAGSQPRRVQKALKINETSFSA